MTTQSYAKEQTKLDRGESVSQKLMYRFSSMLGRTGACVDALESMGHKISNTNYPKPEDGVKQAAQVQNEGLLSEIEVNLNQLEVYNLRFEELIKKLSELI